LSETHTQEIYEAEAESGWKYVNVQLGLKNNTGEFVDINDMKFLENKEEIKIKTEQGWTYSLSEHFNDNFFPLLGDKFESNLYKIPGNFVVIGSYFHTASIGYYYLRFKVAEKSSGYKLILPGYPDIDLNKSNKEIILPTDLPDSSFNNVGDKLAITDKGYLVIENFIVNPISDEVTIDATLSNASEGYDQEFNINFFLIGNDGILRASQSYKERYINSPIKVGPGQNFSMHETFSINKELKNLMLIITGDIDAVINPPSNNQINENKQQSYENTEIRFNPRIVGSIDMCTEEWPRIGYCSFDITVKGNYAFLLADDFKILDVSQKENPKILSSLYLFDNNSEEEIPNSIFVLDNYAYITSGLNGLQIIDISNKSNPKIVSNTITSTLDDENEEIIDVDTGVFVLENYMYVTNSNGLKIFNVIDKTNPILVSSLDCKEYTSGHWFQDVVVEGNYAYIIGYYGLLIIDISNIERPKFIGSLEEGGDSIVVKNDCAFIGYNSLKVVDIYLKEYPKLIDSKDLYDTVKDIFYDGRYVYACAHFSGFKILDTTDKKNISEIYSFPEDMIAIHLDIENNFAYITTESTFVNELLIMNDMNPIFWTRS